MDACAAGSLLSRSVSGIRRNWSSGRTKVSATLMEMGAVLQRQGKLADAMAKYERAERSFAAEFGSEHTHTQDARKKIAVLDGRIAKSSGAMPRDHPTMPTGSGAAQAEPENRNQRRAAALAAAKAARKTKKKTA